MSSTTLPTRSASGYVRRDGLHSDQTDGVPLLPGNHRWFTRLVNSPGALLTQYTSLLHNENLVVSFEVPNRFTPSDTTRMYSAWRTPMQFFQWYDQVPQDSKTCYEIIPTAARRKFYLDFDYPLKEGEIYESLLREAFDAVVRMIQQTQILFADPTFVHPEKRPLHPILPTDFRPLICQSHRPGTKISFHIIFTGASFTSAEDTKLIFEALKQRLLSSAVTSRWCSALDAGVYTANQSFRMLGSSKLKKSNWKKLILKGEQPELSMVPMWEPKPYHVASIEQHHAALLTNLTDTTPFSLARRDGGRPPPTSTMSARPPTTATELVIANAYQYAEQALLEMSQKYATPFKIRDNPSRDVTPTSRGVIVPLIRTAASECPICLRVHEHENPYMIVESTPEGDLTPKTVTVSWFCRRNDAAARPIPLVFTLAPPFPKS